MKKLFSGVVVLLIAIVAGVAFSFASEAEVLGVQKISNLEGDLGSVFAAYEGFGTYVTNIGDIDSDGDNDLVVGSPYDNDGGTGRGAIYLLYMDPDGTLDDETPYKKFSDTQGGFTAVLDDNDNFGGAVEFLGDLNNDGGFDIAVGAALDDDGGSTRGAVYILYLDPDGTLDDETPFVKISDTQGNFGATLADSAKLGIDLANVGDVDGNGTNDIATTAIYTDEGVGKGAVYILFTDTDGGLVDAAPYTWVNESAGEFTAVDGFSFGIDIDGIGDINGDGVPDLSVGALFDDDGGNNAGAALIYFLDSDGTLHDTLGSKRFSATTGELTGVIAAGDNFGQNISLLGDIDANGVNDIAVASTGDTSGEGSVYVLFLESNGDLTETGYVRFSQDDPIIGDVLEGTTSFGASISTLGDINGDTVPDFAAASYPPEGGDPTVIILLMDSDGTLDDATPYLIINDQIDNFGYTLDQFDQFGIPLVNIGDLNGDGTNDLIVGAPGDDDGADSAGAIYTVFLNEIATSATSAGSTLRPTLTFDILNDQQCSSDETLYIEVGVRGGMSVYIADNERFTGSEQFIYRPGNAGSVLPSNLMDQASSSKMYIAWSLPDEIRDGSIYELFAVARGRNSGSLSSVVIDSIRHDSAENCNQNESTDGLESRPSTEETVSEVESIQPEVQAMPVEPGDIIGSESVPGVYFYVTENLQKRSFPDASIFATWSTRDEVVMVSAETLSMLPNGEPMLPKGPSIVLFPGNNNYHYISMENTAPREITTPGLVEDLFGTTNWQSLVRVMPNGLERQITKGRQIVRFEQPIMVEWREFIRSL